MAAELPRARRSRAGQRRLPAAAGYRSSAAAASERTIQHILYIQRERASDTRSAPPLPTALLPSLLPPPRHPRALGPSFPWRLPAQLCAQGQAAGSGAAAAPVGSGAALQPKPAPPARTLNCPLPGGRGARGCPGALRSLGFCGELEREPASVFGSKLSGKGSLRERSERQTAAFPSSWSSPAAAANPLFEKTIIIYQ